MLPNTASQQFHVIAFNASGRVSGDAANITATLSIDGAARAALADVNPVEIGTTGEYVFDLTQAETNGHELSFVPASATAGVQVLGAPSNVIYTHGSTEMVANAVVSAQTGGGDNAVTVTVSDGDAAVIQGARVSIVGTTLKLTTGSDGTAVFNLDAGSYTVRVSAPSGYADPDDTAVTVDGTEAVAITVSTTGSVTPPDNPLLATLAVLCIDEVGASEAGVSIEAKLVAIPEGGTGLAYDGTVQTVTSDADGVATLTVVRLATYDVKRGTGTTWRRVTIADEATTTITSFIGTP